MDGQAATRDAGEALFRREAVEGAAERLGLPVRPVGLADWALWGFLVLIFTTATIFICTASYARKERVIGVLQPAGGVLRMTSPRAATVSDVLVIEGQQVAAGQPVAILTMDPVVAGGRRLADILTESSAAQRDALREQAEAHQTLLASKRAELVAHRAAIAEMLRRSEDEVQLQKERVELTAQSTEAAAKLYEKQLLPALQYRQRQEALLASRQALSAAERERGGLKSQIIELGAQEATLLAEAAEARAQLRTNAAQLGERSASNDAESRIVITAPASGRIATLQVSPGGSVAPGAAIATVIPKGSQLRAELWAPSRAVGFVRPGDRARLMYDAFPYQRFSVGRGRVLEVSLAPTQPNELPVPIRTEEALYRVVIALDKQSVAGYGREWPLASGMRLSADLVLEDQSLAAWLFDKVRAGRKLAQKDA